MIAMNLHTQSKVKPA